MSIAFGNRLHDARVRAGMSQAALARAVDVSTVTIWRWETQGMLPSGSHAAALAKALGISLDWLLSTVDTPEDRAA